MARQWRRIVFLNIFVLLLGKSVFGDSPSCTVGDLTQGHWELKNKFDGICKYPGPPALGAYWPVAYTMVNASTMGEYETFRIHEDTKIVSRVWGYEFSITKPPEELYPECITGFTKEYTKVRCELLEWGDSHGEGFYDYVYDPSTNICTVTSTRPGEEDYIAYFKMGEWRFDVLEWVCNPTIPIDDDKNFDLPPC